MKQNRMTRQPPEEIQPFLDNPFLKDFRGRDIIYTKDFYVAMYKKISEEHMTYVAAYNSLGFSTAVLGEDRANSAGKRAMQLGREGRLFTADPSSYDGSVPREAMGAMSPLEELAYLKARNAYLEELVAAQKKLRSALEDTTIALKSRDTALIASERVSSPFIEVRSPSNRMAASYLSQDGCLSTIHNYSLEDVRFS